MDYVSNREPQIREMLAAIGINEIDELFQAVPDQIKLSPPEVDDGLSEYEGICLMESLAAKNTFPQYDSYLGAGAYEHHVPAIVNTICSKSGFLTSYTPYQAEASQGVLQSIFEYQTAICTLTGMDVSNASVYDGASACAEALLMALRAQRGRKKLLIAKSLHPHYRGVIDQYLFSQDVDLVPIPFLSSGQLDMEFLFNHIDVNTAAILVQYPNFFGIIDEIKKVSKKAQDVKALTIVCANPLAYGLFSSAGELGADIAVGDCQPFGSPLQYGGPYTGYVACRHHLVRQLPGRIVGQTTDAEGRRGYVLTLQAREQHIRREKATSSICTNQALSALASAIAMLWYGKKGIQELALTNFQRTAYLREQLSSLPGVELFSDAPVFNEFAVKFDRPLADIQHHFRQHGIEPGVDLGQYFPELKDYLLVAVTETKSQQQLDHYLEVAKKKEMIWAS